MRYTKYNTELRRWEVPCCWKEDGERLTFHFREEPGEVITGSKDGPIQLPGMIYVSGGVIDRLAELEAMQMEAPFERRTTDLFIQGYLETDTFYHCPRCGLNYGNLSELKRRGRFRYCMKCGQALDWPKETGK